MNKINRKIIKYMQNEVIPIAISYYLYQLHSNNKLSRNSFNYHVENGMLFCELAFVGDLDIEILKDSIRQKLFEIYEISIKKEEPLEFF